jgi:hypothetical protein
MNDGKYKNDESEDGIELKNLAVFLIHRRKKAVKILNE